MTNTWDFSNKKWLYWTSVIGFVLILFFQPSLWILAVILYFIFDREKPKTQNYQIEKVYEKYMIIVGNLGLILLTTTSLLLILKLASL